MQCLEALSKLQVLGVHLHHLHPWDLDWDLELEDPADDSYPDQELDQELEGSLQHHFLPVASAFDRTSPRLFMCT